MSLIKKIQTDTVKTTDLIGFQMSNIENFHFVTNRKNYYKKIYFSFKYNAYNYNKSIEEKFKEVMISGTNQDYKNVNTTDEK